MHAFSLAWTILAATLVVLITNAVLGNIRWATLAGIFFAVHPANYLTTGWIACQNEQMMTVFVLAGLLCYGKYSGWFAWHGQARAAMNGGMIEGPSEPRVAGKAQLAATVRERKINEGCWVAHLFRV
ncbi:MAG: hypothetical protein JSV03_02590, partial [Planctomycetota bacterium]